MLVHHDDVPARVIELLPVHFKVEISAETAASMRTLAGVHFSVWPNKFDIS